MSILIPTDIRQHPLDQPLPFDLFNQQGTLVACGGSLVETAERLANLVGMRLFRQGDENTPGYVSPVNMLNALGERYAELLGNEWLDSAELARLGGELHLLTMAHPEVCVGHPPHMTNLSQAKRHALLTAAVGILTARAMVLDEPAQQTIARAALSMNLTSHRLQDTLLRHARQPTDAEREQLQLHPWQAAEALARQGVTDESWLMAVNQHHENLDGSGYPFGIGADAITSEARILRVVDVFGALISQRNTRTGHYAYQAIRVAFERERRRLDDSAMLSLRRVIGRYPPGTLVRLYNRETALVTRWFRGAPVPKHVVSFLRPSGEALLAPQKRSTANRMYNIREYTYLPLNHPVVDWARVWAEG